MNDVIRRPKDMIKHQFCGVTHLGFWVYWRGGAALNICLYWPVYA